MSETPPPPSSEAETLASLRAALKNRRQDGGQQAEKSAPPTAEPEQAKTPLPETPVAAAPPAQAPKMVETPVPAKPEQQPTPAQQNPRPPKDNWEPTPPKPQHQQQQQKKKQPHQQEQRKNPPRPPQQQDQQRKQQPQQQTPPSQPAPKSEAEEESPADRLKRLLDSHRQKASQDSEKPSEKAPTPPASAAPKEPEKKPEKKEEPAASPVDALRKQMEEKRLARQNTPPISLEKTPSSPAPDVVQPAPPKISLEKAPLTVPTPQVFMPPPPEAMPNFVYQDPLQKRNANPFAGVIAQFDKLKRTALGRFLKSLIKFTQNTLAVLTWTILFAIPCNLGFLAIINFDAFDARYWNALNILYTTSKVPWIYVLTLLGAAVFWLLGAILAWYKGWRYCGRVYGVVLKISLLPLGFLLLIVYGICRLIQEIINRR